MTLINEIKSHFQPYFINSLGWKTSRKIIVIESDDWGSNRMPNKESFEQLITKLPLSINDSLDSLERKEDFDAINDVLLNHKNYWGQTPKVTMNVVMGNPDFTKIKVNGFQKFEHQHFFDSYQDYYGQDLVPDWKEGIRKNLIKPQFHAREHLNKSLWMHDLKSGNIDTLFAFKHNFYMLKTTTSSTLQSHYLAAYFAENDEDFKDKTQVLKDGLKKFKDTFGFSPRSFIACNYVWPKELERILKDGGD